MSGQLKFKVISFLIAISIIGILLCCFLRKITPYMTINLLIPTLSIYAINYFRLYSLHQGSKLFRKFKFWWTFSKFQKASKSINHTQNFMAKMLLNLPISSNETEMRSYLDIKNHFGEKVPVHDESF